MYQDNISALMGAGQDPQEQQLAQALRGQQAGGDMLGLSTIGQVSALGNNMNKRTNAAAKQAGGLKKAMQEREAKVGADSLLAKARAAEQSALNEDRDATREGLDTYRVDQQTIEREKMAETKRKNDLTHDAALARNKAYAASKNTGLPKRQKEAQTFQDIGTTTAEIMDVADSFDDAYGTESKVPKLGALQNYVATETPAFATKGMQEQRDWWAKWGIIYTLPERHALFGAALTKEEKPEWEKHAINPDMPPDVIRENMTWLVNKARAVAKRQVGNAKVKGWSDEYIDVNYGMLGLDEDDGVSNTAEDLEMKDAVMGLTVEEEAELADLEARLNGVPQ